MATCKACGKESVVEDEENGRTILVCTLCGILQNDTQEYVTANFAEGTSLSDGQARAPRGAKTGVSHKPKPGIQFGTDNIRRIGKCLGFNEDMISEATSMYKQVFDRKLNKTAIDTKLAMCGACMYTTGRQHGKGFSVKDVCKYLEIEKSGKKLAKALSILKKNFNIQPPTVAVSAETDHVLSQTDFSPEIHKLTHDIMSLCERYWLSQGRNKSITIVVALFFACRAFTSPKEKLEFTAFCKKYNYSLTDASKNRHAEVQKLLQAVVQEIPWLKGRKLPTIDPYIKDAVTFQASLMPETLKSGASKIDTPSESGSSQSVEKQQSDKDFGTMFRKNKKQRPNTGAADLPTATCDKERKRALEKLDRDSDEINFDLGSDDDTDLYIRTAEEVKYVRELQGGDEEKEDN